MQSDGKSTSEFSDSVSDSNIVSTLTEGANVTLHQYQIDSIELPDIDLTLFWDCSLIHLLSSVKLCYGHHQETELFLHICQHLGNPPLFIVYIVPNDKKNYRLYYYYGHLYEPALVCIHFLPLPVLIVILQTCVQFAACVKSQFSRCSCFMIIFYHQSQPFISHVETRSSEKQ